MRKYFPLYRHGQPVLHPIVDNQIEEGRRYEASLGCPPFLMEVRAMLPILTGDDLLPLPELCQDPAHVWYRAVALQCCQEAAPVQSFI